MNIPQLKDIWDMPNQCPRCCAGYYALGVRVSLDGGKPDMVVCECGWEEEAKKRMKPNPTDLP